MIPIRTDRCRCDQRFMIPENLLVVQIEIIIADLLSCRTVFTKRIVKSCIQMIICTTNFYDIPSMTVLDPFFRIVTTDCDHAPDSKRITEYFHRFCNPFTYANSMSKWTDDLMGIRLFQLIISHIITDKIMNIFLLFPFRQIFCRPRKFFYSGGHCPLMLPDFIFVKQILRYKDQIRRVLIVFILISCHPENLRMIQPKPEKDIIKLRTFYARYLKFIRKCIRSLHDYMVCCLLLFRHFGIIEWFHESPPAQCFDSPIIHFFTKTRNVFPCFLTKNRNVLR